MNLAILDMGGVVCENTDTFPSVAAYLGLSEAEFCTTADGAGLGLLYCGMISEREFWEGFSRKYGRNLSQDLWGRFFRPRLNREVAGLISQLRRCARVVVGTNTFDSHYAALAESGHYAYFDAIYASNKMGVAKPAHEFYQRILDAEVCSPEEALFVDDVECNVAAAEAVGMRGVLFRGVSDLERAVGEVLIRQRR